MEKLKNQEQNYSDIFDKYQKAIKTASDTAVALGWLNIVAPILIYLFFSGQDYNSFLNFTLMDVILSGFFGFLAIVFGKRIKSGDDKNIDKYTKVFVIITSILFVINLFVSKVAAFLLLILVWYMFKSRKYLKQLLKLGDHKLKNIEYKIKKKHWIIIIISFFVAFIGSFFIDYGHYFKYSAVNYNIESTDFNVKDGWVRLNIGNVASIDYPTDILELQSGSYKEFSDEWQKQTFDIDTANFTLQQMGLNDMLEDSFSKFVRVLFSTVEMDGYELFGPNDEFNFYDLGMSKSEFEEESLKIVNQELDATGNRLVEYIDTDIEEINDMYAIVITYTRQLDNNPIVLVKKYNFMNYDKMHTLIFSYRVEDEHIYKDKFEEILDSFIIFNN